MGLKIVNFCEFRFSHEFYVAVVEIEYRDCALYLFKGARFGCKMKGIINPSKARDGMGRILCAAIQTRMMRSPVANFIVPDDMVPPIAVLNAALANPLLVSKGD